MRKADHRACVRRCGGTSRREVTQRAFTTRQNGVVIGILIFAVMAVVVIAAFAAQVSRRRRYERGEYDPDDV